MDRAPVPVVISGRGGHLLSYGRVATWLTERTIGGGTRILRCFGIPWKRARWHTHSPDPHYQAKLSEMARVRALPALSAGRIVVLYMDEFPVFRQPTLAQAYAAVDDDQPLAQHSVHADTETRVVGTLDADAGESSTAVRARLPSKRS